MRTHQISIPTVLRWLTAEGIVLSTDELIRASYWDAYHTVDERCENCIGAYHESGHVPSFVIRFVRKTLLVQGGHHESDSSRMGNNAPQEGREGSEHHPSETMHNLWETYAGLWLRPWWGRGGLLP